MRQRFKWRDQEVCAAGYLLRCGDRFLMIRESKGWSDLGGKCESCDASARATAAREASEESAGTFPDVEGLPARVLYNARAKYLLHVVEVAECAEVSAPLAWVSAPAPKELHPRLRYFSGRRAAFRVPRGAAGPPRR